MAGEIGVNSEIPPHKNWGFPVRNTEQRIDFVSRSLGAGDRSLAAGDRPGSHLVY